MNATPAALTCYVLAVADSRDGKEPQPRFVNTFVGGPHLMACFENIYGDTTAIFRTAALRAVGGYETDRHTPWEDWLTYIKLVHAGYTIEVVPEFLFVYRVRRDSRTARMIQGPADQDRYTQHLLRKCFRGTTLPPGVDLASLWPLVVSFQRLSDRHETLRHQVVERLNKRLRYLPWLHRGLKRIAKVALKLWLLTWGI